MVFTSLMRLMPRISRSRIGSHPNPGPDMFWRKQQTFRFNWRFRNRARVCYSIAIRYVNRALRYSTIGRKLKKSDMRLLWRQRLEAAAAEHGLNYQTLMGGLARCDIQLDRKVLTDLAIYEPRTFESLCDIAKTKAHQEGLASIDTPVPSGVVTRGML